MHDNEPTNSQVRIKVKANGPYLVIGDVKLTNEAITDDKNEFLLVWKKTGEISHDEECELCRCGNSKEKPFCDGTHKNINFDGTETFDKTPYEKMAKTYHGKDLDLQDAYDLCSSAHFCMRAGSTWDLIKDSDETSKEYAAQEVADCASGRLVLIDKVTNKAIEPHFEPTITFVEDTIEGTSGPIWIRGRIPIEAADGTTYELRNRATVCRCGGSKNKPFCDSTHISINFKA